MELTINKKKYILSFGMTCWEEWFKKTSSYKKDQVPDRLDSLADIIDAAILDSNRVDRLNQKLVKRDVLRTWINQSGTTEQGYKDLCDIENSLTEMYQYKQILKFAENKKKATTP